MSEGNAIRVIEGQPEAAAIEFPHEAGRDLGPNPTTTVVAGVGLGPILVAAALAQYFGEGCPEPGIIDGYRNGSATRPAPRHATAVAASAGNALWHPAGHPTWHPAWHFRPRGRWRLRH